MQNALVYHSQFISFQSLDRQLLEQKSTKKTVYQLEIEYYWGKNCDLYAD